MVLHVVERSLPSSMRRQVMKAAEDDIRAGLEKLGGADPQDTRVDVVIGSGHSSIVEHVKTSRADLLVLGLHSDESGKRPLKGTTMERVVRYCPVPVLVVSDRVSGAYETVLVALDFSVFSRRAIRGAYRLAPGGDMWFAHAFQVPFAGFQYGSETRAQFQAEAEEELESFIMEELEAVVGSVCRPDGLPISRRAMVRNGEVRAVLREVATELKPDLMVLGTHGRVGFPHMMLGSVAEHFLVAPPCDVLAVKAW